MFSNTSSDKTLSIALALSAGAWGLYWYPLRTIENVGIAGVFQVDPLPDLTMIKTAFPTAAFWSICIFLPCFCIIFRVSQILFPGRVGILTMSEVVVAVITASILVPEERMLLIQWVGAIAIVLAGLIEVLFGHKKTEEPVHSMYT